jgi:hypothetical protein
MRTRDEDETMTATNQIAVPLTATANGKRITISGPPGPFPLAADSGESQFNFTLTDSTGKNVRFTTLDAADSCSTCPPNATGNQSRQIVADHVDPTDPTQASFIDNNNNSAKNGPLDIAFQWHFACNDSSMTLGTYDPIISNGGRN